MRALTRAGLTQVNARLAAEVLVTTDTWGVHTHGTKNLRGYIRRLQAGGLSATAEPRVEAEGPGWARIDGCSALAMVTSVKAMRIAMQKARASGIGFSAVRNSCHFGAAGYYAQLAAQEGMIGIAMANDIPTVIAPGARAAVLGSNPFAFSAPLSEGRPVLFDIATSTVAGGKVFQAATAGETIPEGWIVDESGMPTTDPTLFPHSAALTPMAGHKGFGLALMIEALSGIVTGAALASHVKSWTYADPSLPTDHGAAFIALDIQTFTPLAHFIARFESLAREIRNAPRTPGVDRIFLPGEREWERRERALREGIVLPPDVQQNIELLAQDLGLDYQDALPRSPEVL